MPEIQGFEKEFSFVPRKRLGRFSRFGTSQFGFTNYGDDDIYLVKSEYGIACYGKDDFGDLFLFSGIYRTDNVTGKTKYYREPYYITKNPRYENQQAHRQKYGKAVEAWKDLTKEEKDVYNKRAKGKRYSGWNLFYKEYLLSH